MTPFLSFHEPGFWLVVSLLCTLALLAGQSFLPPAWRTPMAVANWLGIPYLALLAGGVSPRLMGLRFLNWLTVFHLGIGLAAAVLAVALIARLSVAADRAEDGYAANRVPIRHPAARWRRMFAGLGLCGAEEFFWCFLRAATLEILLKLGEPQTAPAYWAVWLAALLALPTVLGLQPTGGLRLGKAAILVATSVLFFYTYNFWLCWAVHALAWQLLTPVMSRAVARPRQDETLPMQYLLFVAAFAAVAYGAYTGQGWALVVGVLLAVAAASRWGAGRSERDAQLVRRVIAALFGHWWKIAFWLAPLGAIAASWLEHRNPVDLLALSAWLLAMGLVVAGSLAHDAGAGLGRTGASTLRWTRADWGAVVILGLVALGLRLYWLDRGLPYMHGDEGEMGQLARLALFGPAPGRGEGMLPFFRTGFLDHPTLFHYIQGWFLLWFGNNVYSLKLLSAVAGALSIPVIYAAGRVGWGWMAGLAAAWLLAVSHLHIHFSRLALNNIESVLFGAAFLLLALVADAAGALPSRRRPAAGAGDGAVADAALADDATSLPGPTDDAPLPVVSPAQNATTTGRLTLFVALGLVIGLSQYFYYGSRLLPVVALPVLFLLWRQRRMSGIHWLGTALAVFVSYWPLFAFYLENWPSFLNRTAGVSILRPDALSHVLGPGAAWPDDIPQLLIHQVQNVLGFLVRDGDRSAFYAAEIPAFDPVTVALFWLGVGVLIASWRRISAQTVLLYLGLGLLLAGVLTNDTPNAPRLIMVVPALVLACGVAAQKAFDMLCQLWPRQQRWLAVGLSLILVAGTLPFNVDAYFVRFWGMQRMALMTIAAEQMERYAATHQAYFLGAPNSYVENGVIRFIAEDADKVNVLDETELRADVQVVTQAGEKKGSLFVVLPHRFAEWEAVRSTLPAGQEESFYDTRGELLLKTYRVDPY